MLMLPSQTEEASVNVHFWIPCSLDLIIESTYRGGGGVGGGGSAAWEMKQEVYDFILELKLILSISFLANIGNIYWLCTDLFCKVSKSSRQQYLFSIYGFPQAPLPRLTSAESYFHEWRGRSRGIGDVSACGSRAWNVGTLLLFCS